MSYTPTIWKNDEAPAINADNLNKLEQGVAAASAPKWADISGKPTLLAIGTTATTAKAGNYTPPNVTTSANGLMLAADKVKLDGLTGKTIVPTAAPTITIPDPVDDDSVQAAFNSLIAALKTAGVLT